MNGKYYLKNYKIKNFKSCIILIQIYSGEGKYDERGAKDGKWREIQEEIFSK